MRTGDETTESGHVRTNGIASGRPNRGRAATSGDGLVRLAVNLGPETSDVLKEYASRKGVSVTEAVRRAIAVLAFVDEAQRRGASINIEENGTVKEVMFLT